MHGVGYGNTNINPNNVIFTIKDTKLFFLVVNLLRRTIKTCQNFWAKTLKDHFTGMNIKQKVRVKICQMNIDIYSSQIFSEVIDYLF